MIFIGCDPGLLHPGMAMMKNDEVVAFALPAPPKSTPLWQRADLVAISALEKASRMANFYYSQVVLGIESAAFIPHSRSMEQMACCRQALYSHFSAEIRPDLFHAYEINPSEAKRAISSGNATKRQVVEVVRVMHPQLFDGLEVYTSRGKLTDEATAIADAVAITMAARRKWKEEKLCIDSSR